MSALRNRRHPLFLLLGEPLALDLVNTLVPPTYGGDLVATPDRVREWLRAEETRLPAGTVEPPGVAALTGLREALAALFEASLTGATPSRGPLTTVNAASRAGAGYLELGWTAGGGPRAHTRHWDTPRKRARGAALLAAVARSGIELLGGPEGHRLRRCEGPGCTLLFVATHPGRRWCSPDLCGNRVRVARNYRRRRGQGIA